MTALPPELEELTDRIAAEAAHIEGFLSPSEIRFLALLAACPRAQGEVLEIGSFKGRSTVVLATAAKFAGYEKIYAVDPLIAPSATDPDLGGDVSSAVDFRQNLRNHGVEENVEFYEELSHELAARWDRPIRLLWIDGDHTYKGTRLDLDSFAPHLADGAIVAIHDVLHEFEGGIRVFCEDILLSPNFGACGFVGSIGWAQYCESASGSEAFAERKLKLYKKAARLIPYVALGRTLSGFERKIYKILRWQVPHGAANPSEWLAMTEDRRIDNQGRGSKI